MTSTLATSTEDADAQITVTISGEIDTACAGDFRSTMLLALTDPAVRRVTVHMGAVSFIDAAGLSALVQAGNAALVLDKRLVLDAVPPCVLRLFDITGLDREFCIASTPAGARPGSEATSAH